MAARVPLAAEAEKNSRLCCVSAITSSQMSSPSCNTGAIGVGAEVPISGHSRLRNPIGSTTLWLLLHYGTLNQHWKFEVD